MTGESTRRELIGAVYEAALDGSRWPRFLEQFADAISGTLTAIFVHDFQSREGNTIWAVRAEFEYLRRYNDYYHARNVYVTRRPERITVGRVLNGQELCSERDVLRSEIHADWMGPQDIFWTTGAAILQEGSVTAILTSMRPHRAAPFGRREVSLQRALLPHLQRAIQIQSRLEGREALYDAASAALDRLPTGVILIDEQCRPMVINRTAQEILDKGDGLTLSALGLSASRADETIELEHAIRAARDTASGRGLASGANLRVSRAEGRRPLSVVVAPLARGRLGLGTRTAAVAVFVSDPGATLEDPEAVLTRLYGLTAAESRLAAALTSGESLAEAAARFGITVSTARTQLKRVFAKTETSRQSELVGLVARSVAILRLAATRE